MRTYSRADWERSLQEWEEGQFSDEWKTFRHRASMRGIIFPPEGTRWDSWEDDQPSQRAILIRAIRETPVLLNQAIDHSKSWYEAVDYLTRRLNEWREELNAKDREAARHKDPTPQQSMSTFAGIFDRVATSLGYVRADRQLREREEPK